jgi:LuxR family maltose regulon positive regulatory protein
VDGVDGVSELHRRASQWYEENGLPIEAFHHAVAGKDFERTARLVQSRALPLHFRGVVTAMLDWLESLPKEAMNARPSLWATYASLLLVNGQTTGVEEKLQVAEAALQDAKSAQSTQDTEADDQTRNYLGQFATARAVLAITRYNAQAVLQRTER